MSLGIIRKNHVVKIREPVHLIISIFLKLWTIPLYDKGHKVLLFSFEELPVSGVTCTTI